MSKVYLTKSLEIYNGHGSIKLSPDPDGLGLVEVSVDEYFGGGRFIIDKEVALKLSTALNEMVENIKELEDE